LLGKIKLMKTKNKSSFVEGDIVCLSPAGIIEAKRQLKEMDEDTYDEYEFPNNPDVLNRLIRKGAKCVVDGIVREDKNRKVSMVQLSEGSEYDVEGVMLEPKHICLVDAKYGRELRARLAEIARAELKGEVPEVYVLRCDYASGDCRAPHVAWARYFTSIARCKREAQENVEPRTRPLKWTEKEGWLVSSMNGLNQQFVIYKLSIAH
jgi:hypothetical protein